MRISSLGRAIREKFGPRAKAAPASAPSLLRSKRKRAKLAAVLRERLREILEADHPKGPRGIYYQAEVLGLHPGPNVLIVDVDEAHGARAGVEERRPQQQVLRGIAAQRELRGDDQPRAGASRAARGFGGRGQFALRAGKRDRPRRTGDDRCASRRSVSARRSFGARHRRGPP